MQILIHGWQETPQVYPILSYPTLSYPILSYPILKSISSYR